MAKIKIISNPYNREISFFSYKEQTELWENIRDNNVNSRLREDESVNSFLPFKIKEIVDIIIEEYYIGTEKVDICFQGTEDEYKEVETICNGENVKDKVNLIKSLEYLENARDILEDIKETFNTVHPVIKTIIKDDYNVNKNLAKICDALNDIIPICVFGNYSSGKSTFINALIGGEVLPSGGDPVTAKIYKIKRSKFEDRSKIKFSYEGEYITISFEDNSYKIKEYEKENQFLNELNKSISESDSSMLKKVHSALTFINGFEKKEKSRNLIGNVIELEVPFSKYGELGKSDNKFVIFDTPGSNSASNKEHSEILAEALEGFSNGIPVWVSQYETMDSEDNANLCDKISKIDALDKRFTMIILNKADGSNLEEDGFSKEQVKEILEYNSIEKMYSSGIYFVSSIMGLGSKNDGKLVDKHYRRIFRSQKEMYSDLNDEDYVTLYRYNIMPDQIKSNVLEYSSNYNNLIYSNSGLYCIEKEMDNFATKYSAYNKCKMVCDFLNDVIDETNERIESKKKSLNSDKKIRENQLEAGRKELINEISKKYGEKETSFYKKSKLYLGSYIDKYIDCSITVENMETMDNAKREFHSQRNRELKKLENSSNDKSNKDSHNIIENLKNTYKNNERKKEIECNIDKLVSDNMINYINQKFSEDVTLYNHNICTYLKAIWQQNSEEIRSLLIKIVTESDELSPEERNEISNEIIMHNQLDFENNNNQFIKEKFLKGKILGLKLNNSERLNIKKLTKNYNKKINNSIHEMASEINNNCFMDFRMWYASLSSKIEENITRYNPKLREITQMIKEDTEKIIELEQNQQKISSSLKSVNDLMSIKVYE